MPSTAATSARGILTGLHDVMAKKEEPVAEILAELVDEAAAALGSRG